MTLDPFPRPEVYLSDKEFEWAVGIRSMLPRNQPVALVCSNSVTDNCVARTGELAWQEWVNILAKRFTIVHLAVTRLSVIEEAVRLHPRHRDAWRPEQILDNCFVLENLPTRRFFAAFSIGDFFFGPNSAGSHLAAAFDIPSLVVLNSAQYADFPTFPDVIHKNHWKHESFLYPYQSFLKT